MKAAVVVVVVAAAALTPGLKVMQQMEKDLTSEAGDGAAQRGGRCRNRHRPPGCT